MGAVLRRFSMSYKVALAVTGLLASGPIGCKHVDCTTLSESECGQAPACQELVGIDRATYCGGLPSDGWQYLGCISDEYDTSNDYVGCAKDPATGEEFVIPSFDGEDGWEECEMLCPEDVASRYRHE